MQNKMNPQMGITSVMNHLKISRQGVHNKIKTLGISSMKQGKTSYITHKEAKKLFNIKFKPKIISTHIVKGGCGKTTVTRETAIRANLYGAKVLIVDMDPQGDMTSSFGVDAYEHNVLIDVINDDLKFSDSIIKILPGLDLFPSRIENSVVDKFMYANDDSLFLIRDYLNTVKKNYDFIFIDCPSSFGKSISASILASDIVLCPIKADTYSENALGILYDELEAMRKEFDINPILKIVVNDFDKRKTASYDTYGKIMFSEKYRNCFIKSQIFRNQIFENQVKNQLSIYDISSANTAKDDIDMFTKTLIGI